MKLMLRGAWITELMKRGFEREELQDTMRWTSEDRWVEMHAERFTSPELAAIREIVMDLKDPVTGRPAEGVTALLQKMGMWSKLRANPVGQVIKRLEALEAALKTYIAASPRQWLFKDEDDGIPVPYYVVSIAYQPSREDRDQPASTTITLSAAVRGAKSSQSVVYHQDDLGDNVVNLLRKRGYYLETPEIVAEYEKSMARYKAISALTGAQFNAIGSGFSAGTSRYWRGTVSMERDGAPSRVVMDDMDDLKKEDDRDRGEEKVLVVSSKYWNADATKKKSRDDLEDDDVVVLPPHPYVKVFDLRKHDFAVIHVNFLAEYEYDPALVEKLILPENKKQLVGMLIAGSNLIMEDIVKGKTGGIIVIATGPPGTGKCHGRGTKLLKADGRTVAVEDVRLGDLLMGDDSTPRTVLSLAAGKDTLYRVTPLRGGEPFTVNSEHVMVFAESPTEVDEPVGVVEMALRDYLAQSRTRKHHLKLYRVPVDYPEAAKPTVDPYWLGLWLGDGNAGYTGITTMDVPVADYVRVYAEKLGLAVSVKEQVENKSSVYTIVGTRSGPAHDNRLLDMLAGLGLSVQRDEDNRRHGSEKFIPHCYLTGSREVRSALLAGVVDSDGYTSKGDGVYDGTFKSQRFAQELVQLARSLGYTASVVPKKGTIKSIGFVGDYYRVCLSAVHDLPLKIARRKSKAVRGQKKRAQVTGFTLENLGVDDYFGFTLTGNGRYLLSDFTVTHNTLTAEVFSEEIKRPLYAVQCSQLGTDEETLEKKLSETLDRAARWKAILLIDEADVYVHARGEDIEQNAIVGVFLRVLEQYRGVMFMTSNRDTVIDDAIMSRATAWIKYLYPSKDEAKRIWAILAANYAVLLSEPEIKRLVDEFNGISGRSIKNLLKLSKLLALQKQEKVTVANIKYVAQFLDLEYAKAHPEPAKA